LKLFQNNSISQVTMAHKQTTTLTTKTHISTREGMFQPWYVSYLVSLSVTGISQSHE